MQLPKDRDKSRTNPPLTLPLLKEIRHWIFDMDGTLTKDIHDFAMMKRVLEVPAEGDILTHLETLPEADYKARHRWLEEYELKLAKASQPALGTRELIHFLAAQGAQLAVLTRNKKELAHLTLNTIGLLPYFEESLILGRDEALPKPDPDGVERILSAWNITPEKAVIVGDHAYDLGSGRNAGIYTILVNHPHNIHPELSDLHFSSNQELLAALKAK